jgi:hypothetical protein
MAPPTCISFPFEGSQGRNFTKDDRSIWLVLKDLCDVLGIRVDNVMQRLDEDDYYRIEVTDTTGRVRRVPDCGCRSPVPLSPGFRTSTLVGSCGHAQPDQATSSVDSLPQDIRYAMPISSKDTTADV